MTIPSDKKHYQSVDILKGISIILIILTHVQMTNEQKTTILAPYWIWAAVPLFMIISGFTYAMSAERMGLSSPLQWFNKAAFGRKCKRLFFPFLVAIGLELLIFLRKGTFDPKGFIRIMLLGGSGPGGYYNSMLLQLLVCFPFLYIAIKQSGRKGFLGIVFLNFLYEMCVVLLLLPADFYRICLFRYLAAIAMGICIWRYKDILNKTVISGVLLFSGASFLFLLIYGGGLNFVPKIVLGWQTTSLFTVPYAAAIVIFFVENEMMIAKFTKWVGKKEVLSLIGKASYHIFLTQMVYFLTNISTRIFAATNLLISIVVDVVICVVFGLLFYYCEQGFWYLIRSMSHKNSECA